MKREMISEIQKTLREAKAYMKKYEKKYDRIWLDDRKVFLDNFLIYGRPLLPEEVGTIGEENCKLKENPPTLNTFIQMVFSLLLFLYFCFFILTIFYHFYSFLKIPRT